MFINALRKLCSFTSFLVLPAASLVPGAASLVPGTASLVPGAAISNSPMGSRQVSIWEWVWSVSCVLVGSSLCLHGV